MNRKPRSILEEINNSYPTKNRDDFIEAKANHIIVSAIYLFEMIEQNYSEEESEQLKRRFFSSIRGADPKRFERMIKRVKENANSKFT